MEKDLKGMIDVIDQGNKTQSMLERKIETLKEEINRLKFTIQEQKLLIQSLKDNEKDDDLGVNDDIHLLKEMIFTQRQDILKKDRDIEILKQKVDQFHAKDGNSEGEASLMKELNEAREEIERLTTEVEIYKANDDNAKSLLKKLSEENENLNARLQDLDEGNFVEDSSELSSLNADNFMREIEDYQAQVISLQQSLESSEKASLDLREQYEIQMNHLKTANAAYEAEIDSLRAQVNNLSIPKDYKDTTELKMELKSYYDKVYELQEELKEKRVKLEEKTQREKELEELLQNSLKGSKKKAKKKKKKGDMLKEEDINTETERKLLLEIEEYREQIKILEEGKNEPGQLKEMLNEQFTEHLKSENEDLREQILLLNQEIEILKNDIDSGSQDVISSSDTAEELESKLSLLEEENIQLKNELQQEKSNKENILGDIEEQSRKIADLDEEISQKKVEIVELGSINNDLKLLNQNLEERLNSLSGMNRDELESIKRDNAELLDSISKIKEEKSKLGQKVSELEKNRKVQQSSSIEVGLNQDFEIPFSSTANSVIQDLKTENQDQASEIKKLKTELSVKLSNEEQLKQHIENLNNELKDLKRTKVQQAIDPSIASEVLHGDLLVDLDDQKKEHLISALQKGIKESQDYETKKKSINLISMINDNRVDQLFSELVHDINWTVRFHLVKALEKRKTRESSELLEILANDKDIDVREAAQNALEKR
ncbi:MAG: HEAT repeat domain-containing protein [Promethearchaeota archaeon]